MKYSNEDKEMIQHALTDFVKFISDSIDEGYVPEWDCDHKAVLKVILETYLDEPEEILL